MHESSGWIKGYNQPYSHRTSDLDIDSAVPLDARYVLLAAYSVSGERSTGCRPTGRNALMRAADCKADQDGNFDDAMVFSLAAWGSRDKVLRTTHDRTDFQGGETSVDTEACEDGVYYYRWPNHAMGFSSDPRLCLYFADSVSVTSHHRALPHRLVLLLLLPLLARLVWVCVSIQCVRLYAVLLAAVREDARSMLAATGVQTRHPRAPSEGSTLMESREDLYRRLAGWRGLRPWQLQ